MITKATFIEALDRSLKSSLKGSTYPNIQINIDEADFDIEETLFTWGKEHAVKIAVVNIARLTKEDLEALPEILKEKTVFLLKDFGNLACFSARESYHSLIKDGCYGWNSIFAENFLFAVATITAQSPLKDMGEKSCFRLLRFHG